MNNIKSALSHFSRQQGRQVRSGPLDFAAFLQKVSDDPEKGIRNIFQVFHDMVEHLVGAPVDEYAGDPESINYVYHDTTRLFVEGADSPFFADRLFSNRLIQLAENFRHGSLQNKIYIFSGPHGSGKSTFLDNLLAKLEEYANSAEGCTFEALWRLDRRLLGTFSEQDSGMFLNRLAGLLDEYEFKQSELIDAQQLMQGVDEYIEIPCPSHDSPLLMIPKEYRREFIDDLFKNDQAKWKLFTEKQYDWLFNEQPCTICSSLYQALLERLKSPVKALEMLFARPYHFNRRLGEGISVYNPGDRILKENVLDNSMLQNRMNLMLRDSNLVRYLYSNFAKTNNGVYALMDIKGHNVERLHELHNIISEGVHKVEYIEEHVNSLFLALMNPEDRARLDEIPSLIDRVELINIPYVLDLRTEVEIYRNAFGRHIDASFLPRVMHNFARIIISTRLAKESPAMLEWIGSVDKYQRYCDDHLHLLKMEIYTGNIPEWLNEDDRKKLTARRRRQIIAESESEGVSGFSGRDSIRIFRELYSSLARENSLIDMKSLCRFFESRPEWQALIPEGFIDSLCRMYNYTIMQEVKEALYYYNEEQIEKEIKNYLFAINFEAGTQVTSPYTGDKLLVGDELFGALERRLVSPAADLATRLQFRKATQKLYASQALTQELILAGKALEETELYHSLHERYVHYLKEKVLDPLLKNENFRRAIKDFEGENFRTYDRKVRDDVTFLINNLCERFKYTGLGAREVALYLIDNRISEEFAEE
ncbi:serine protein kinase PrkA [Geopsychrobacter electrodiphilus]|uniref:serine protein kinase PrkA n=1 Tax=Geopsychrobacter electrodiphilus TaxID=225196 RepID=UPI0003610F13|nr:serine protein kinase PrkA [Geopsychrobacter electrodiphilus]